MAKSYTGTKTSDRYNIRTLSISDTETDLFSLKAAEDAIAILIALQTLKKTKKSWDLQWPSPELCSRQGQPSF